MRCKTCDKPFETRKQKVYCSNTCQMVMKTQLIIERWKSGEISGNRGSGRGLALSSSVRRYIFEKYHGKCARCGWNEINPVTGKTPLAVDHINGDSRDSKEENLILLCPNCHSLTPTYGKLNEGKGR